MELLGSGSAGSRPSGGVGERKVDMSNRPGKSVTAIKGGVGYRI